MCDGTKLFKHSGYHNPRDPYKWKSCPYCDYDGLQIIEAHENTILQYFDQLDTEQQKALLKKLQDI
jgi:hypothetical protein